MHILVVEDEIVLLGSIQRALLRKGYNVTTAMEAGQALKILENPRNGVDLVVTDYDMTGVGGLEVIQRVKESCKHRVPVILITAHSGAGFKEKAFNAGCDGFIYKPFTTENIIGEMQRIFKGVKAP